NGITSDHIGWRCGSMPMKKNLHTPHRFWHYLLFHSLGVGGSKFIGGLSSQ
ncbi:hypothetical protein NDU88_003903, partial [Pleurodeles waltl]